MNGSQPYNPSDYPPFAVTVDLSILTIRDGALSVLLVQRAEEPYAGSWALPGGFVGPDEDALTAARRELHEETGTLFDGHLEQLATYSDPDRDPRMRVVSVAHVAFAPNLPQPQAGSDAAAARWWQVADVLGGELDLAFDHARILADALERVRSKLEYTTLATQFVGQPFTLGELRAVYLAVWGAAPDLANFRRKVLATPGFVRPLERTASRRQGRPALLYEAGDGTVLQPAMLRA